MSFLDLFRWEGDSPVKVEPVYIVDDADKNTLFEHTDTRLWRAANYFIILLILASVFLVMFESMGNYGDFYLREIFLADFLISFFFWIEYIYRFINSDHKKKFPFRLSNVLDLLSFLPFFVMTGFLGVWNYTSFTIFRLFRIFKIFELFSRLPILLKLSKWIYRHKIEYSAGFFIISMILIFFSTAIYLIENNYGSHTEFTSIPATLWWAVVTMTTVWYGDMVPHTIIGKILWAILMFLGPIVIAIISSLTVFIFLESTKMISYNRSECTNCWVNNAKDSNFCRHCGHKLQD